MFWMKKATCIFFFFFGLATAGALGNGLEGGLGKFFEGGAGMEADISPKQFVLLMSDSQTFAIN